MTKQIAIPLLEGDRCYHCGYIDDAKEASVGCPKCGNLGQVPTFREVRMSKDEYEHGRWMPVTMIRGTLVYRDRQTGEFAAEGRSLDDEEYRLLRRQYGESDVQT